jgi:hypothetical protein
VQLHLPAERAGRIGAVRDDLRAAEPPRPDAQQVAHTQAGGLGEPRDVLGGQPDDLQPLIVDEVEHDYSGTVSP